ncbi:MAG: TolC family protein [Sphingomonadales bacterium]|jgi:cobalt-zinc-cadmium efflux system outer membrane protein
MAPSTLNALPITLSQARDSAAAANIDIIHARQARLSALAGQTIAAARPNPVLSYESSQVRRRLPAQGNVPTADQIVRIDQPIELGGKRSARIKAASAAAEAATDDLADARRQVLSQVDTAYAALRAAQDRAATTAAIAGDWARSYAIAARRLAAGDLSAGEAARQRVEAVRADADALAARSELRQAQTELAILIGRDADAAQLVAADPWPAPPLPVPLPPEDVAARRPDVRAAAARLAQARHELTGARALRVPDISVGVQYEYQSQPIGVGPSVGFGIAVPLPVGTRYSGEIAQAGAALGDAEATAEKALRAAVADISAARSALATSVERRRRLETELLPAAQEAARTAEFAYARGALPLTDLLDARRALAAASLGLVDAHQDEAAAAARLQAAESSGDTQ